MKPPALDRQVGFTLIELVVVFVILGLVLSLVISRAQGPSAGLTLRAAANELAAGLRATRSRAIATNRPTELRLDLAQRSWQDDTGSVHRLPPDASVSLLGVSSQVRSKMAGSIGFQPDGSSTGGQIELQAGNSRIDVGIDWLSGRVAITKLP